MLSILIPIYNFNVEALVTEIVNQGRKLQIPFEVLCFDDHSRKKYRSENFKISGKFGVSYIELSENYGRSKIRNTLAKNARYEYLLFIDCDSKILSNNYLENYIKALKPDRVINGGRIYKPKRPRSLKKRLHWKYGTTREALPASVRRKKGVMSFHSNNFVIPRKLFEKFPFDTNLTTYGYEDIVFASLLKKQGIPIVDIDNPVEHLGVEQTDKFLEKTDKALQNLCQLNKQSLVEEVRLVKTYKKFQSMNLLPTIIRIYNHFEKRIIKNLYSPNPHLKFYDLYRLVNFSLLNQKKDTK